MTTDTPPPNSGMERKLAGAVLIALLLGCLLVLLPFISATIWAVVLCVSSWPVYTRLLKWVGNRRTLVAGLMALAMILVVLLPFVIVGASLGDNITSFTATVKQWSTSGPPEPPAWLGKIPVVGQKAAEQWQAITADTSKLRVQAGELIERATPKLLRIGLAVGAGLMQLALSIFIAFFFFRDGGRLGERVTVAVGRIGGEHAQQLLTMAAGTIRGVVYGVLGTALVQGIATGIGLWIAGVPNAALLALLAFFSAVIPVVGTALIWLPAALWLFSKGATTWGVFLLVWGFGVSNIDNFLKPYLISKGSDMPFILIFFGVLGGAVAFGFIGVFLGPTLLAVGYRLIVEWNAEKPT
jgi:predicted PurR-regulated permease PerM